MNSYEAKKAARLERFRKYAENARKRSEERYKRAEQMSSCIPMGQPILVGHHSEKADRRFRDRIHLNMRAGLEEERTAKYWEERAWSAENSNVIHADDPEALNKLKEKLERLEDRKNRMKAMNAAWKKGGVVGLKEIGAIGATEDEVQDIKRNFELMPWLTKPYPDYAFVNLRNNIKTVKQRIESLGRVTAFEPFSVGEISVTLEEGQIRVNFPYKPTEEIRHKLKCSPIALKWSSWSKCWVRKYTGQGEYFFQELKKVLQESKEEK